MKIQEIAFTCYPVTDMARSRAFYESVLGLTCTMDTGASENGHWVEYDVGPGTLSLGKAPGWLPSPQGASVGLEVEDFDAAVAQIKAANVPIKMGPLETPVCNMIMVLDPDGSVVILHKRKPSHP